MMAASTSPTPPAEALRRALLANREQRSAQRYQRALPVVRRHVCRRGGSVYAGLGIFDTMQYVNPDVATICTGLAASMGAFLLMGGALGKRSALPHARVMIHQPSGGVQGPSADIEITAREVVKLRHELYSIYAERTGKTYQQIHDDSDRDHWLRAEEAKEYGLIDEVLTRPAG